jgi:hypothetical protein
MVHNVIITDAGTVIRNFDTTAKNDHIPRKALQVWFVTVDLALYRLPMRAKRVWVKRVQVRSK